MCALLCRACARRVTREDLSMMVTPASAGGTQTQEAGSQQPGQGQADEQDKAGAGLQPGGGGRSTPEQDEPDSHVSLEALVSCRVAQSLLSQCAIPKPFPAGWSLALPLLLPRLLRQRSEVGHSRGGGPGSCTKGGRVGSEQCSSRLGSKGMRGQCVARCAVRAAERNRRCVEGDERGGACRACGAERLRLAAGVRVLAEHTGFRERAAPGCARCAGAGLTTLFLFYCSWMNSVIATPMWRAAVCGLYTSTSSLALSADTLTVRHPLPAPPPEPSPAATSLTVSAFCTHRFFWASQRSEFVSNNSD